MSPISALPFLTQTKNIFITGIQGLIGWNLYTRLKGRYRVCGFSKTRRSNDGEWYEGLLEDYRCVSNIINHFGPDLVIHTQAMCNIDLCELKPEKTHLINVEATEQLIKALDPKKHKLVYISSDHVFSGKRGDYNEEDIPDPISVYGKTRKAAEEMLLNAYPHCLIIRPGLVIGKSMQGDIGPHDWFLTRLKKNQVASFFTDEIRSPITTEHLIHGILYLIESNASGIYHLGGKESFSRYAIALQLAQSWGKTGDIRQKITLDDKEVPRIMNCTLDSSKAAALGWKIPSFSP